MTDLNPFTAESAEVAQRSWGSEFSGSINGSFLLLAPSSLLLFALSSGLTP